MRHSHIIFLLGFNILATFSYSMTAENADHFTASTEQQIIINGHALETVKPGITTQEIQAARDELMRSLSILIDLQFGIFGGIPLDLTPLHLATPEGTVVQGQNISTTELLSSFNLTNLMSNGCQNPNLNAVLTNLNIAVNRVFFTNQLNLLLNDLKDPAATVTLLEKTHFFPNPDSIQKAILMAFTTFSPATIDRNYLLLKASSAKRANSKKSNTIAAQHLWQTGWAVPLLTKTWDILAPSEQSDVQDLNDAGSVPFQYLKALFFFKDAIIDGETLDINTRIQRLSDLNTDAGHDLWRVIQWHLLYTNQLPASEVENEWQEFFLAIALNKLQISQSLAFRPIRESQDSTTWPTGYKATLYSMTSASAEEPFLNVLRVLAEEVKTLDIADLYLKQFLRESTARNPENNAERIAEIERICEIIPDAKQIIADAICQFDKPLFATEILLDLGLDTPEKRLQKLRELSNQGLERASFYLATAYADSLFEETPLVIHLGIPSRNSLSHEKRTFENLAHIHKENTIQLIRLGLKGNRLAQHFLMTKPENQGLSILEKLFDDRSALSGENDLGAPPCGTDQHSMNRALTHALEFAFSVATILHAPNNVPDFFYEQINRYYRPKTINTTGEFNTKPMLTTLIN